MVGSNVYRANLHLIFCYSWHWDCPSSRPRRRFGTCRLCRTEGFYPFRYWSEVGLYLRYLYGHSLALCPILGTTSTDNASIWYVPTILRSTLLNLSGRILDLCRCSQYGDRPHHYRCHSRNISPSPNAIGHESHGDWRLWLSHIVGPSKLLQHNN